MRKIIPLLLVVLFLCCPTLLAADLSPIVDSQTVAVGRIDLKQVDMEKIMKFLSDEVQDIVPQIAPNPADAGQMILIAQGGLMDAGKYVQPILTALQNEGKAEEIFFIVDKKAASEQIYPLFVAIPAPASKPQAEVDAIRRLFLQNQLQVVFQRHGFIIGMPVIEFAFAEKDEVMSFVRQRYANPSTEKRPEFAEAFGRSDLAGSMLQVVVGDLSMFEEETNMMSEQMPGGLVPPEAWEIFELSKVSQKLMVEKLNYLVVSLNIQKSELKTVTATKDEAAAKELFDLNEKTTRLFIQMLERFKEQEVGVGPAEAGMISAFTFLMGIAETYKPEVTGKEILFSIDGKVYTAMKQAMIEMLKPSITAARGAARRMQCTNNLKHIGLAFHNYHDANRTFPPVYTVDANGKPLHSWRVLILPYIEETALYEQIRLDEPWDSEHNKQFHNVAISIYRCPEATDLQPGMTSYSVVVGQETPFEPGGKESRVATIHDGLSNTILAVERKTPVEWMRPDAEITFADACLGVNKAEKGIGSDHTGGANFCLCDGSVHFISNTIDLTVLKAMLTKAGGESVAW